MMFCGEGIANKAIWQQFKKRMTIQLPQHMGGSKIPNLWSWCFRHVEILRSPKKCLDMQCIVPLQYLRQGGLK
jgi:hypothetical protein